MLVVKVGLIKKTVTLRGESGIYGRVTLIRIGNESAMKLNINMLDHNLFLYLKTNHGSHVFCEIREVETEIKLPFLLNINDKVGVMLTDKAFKTYASGGEKELVCLSDIKHAATQMEYQKQPKPTSSIMRSNIDNEENSDLNRTPNNKNHIATKQNDKQGEDVKNGNAKETRKQQTFTAFDIPRNTNFYRSVKHSLEEILASHDKETTLESLIPNSQWVKISYSDNEYYAVGIIKENDKITNIAYAIPSQINSSVPKEIEEYCSFHMIEPDNINGYWMLLQNINDGTIRKLS